MASRRVLAAPAAALALALALAGCSSPRRDPRPSQPDPLACTTAEDCAPGPLVDPSNVCCDSGVHLSVFSRAYLEWRARILASDCKPRSCPTLPPPTPPLPCATQPRCVQQRCTSSCGT